MAPGMRVVNASGFERSHLRLALSHLSRRTRHRAIRTKHATIAWFRLEAFPATFAFIKEQAGVLRHSLALPMPAFGTGDGGIRDHPNAVVISSRRNCAAVVIAQKLR